MYVGADPVVVSRAQALLRGPSITAIHGDLAEPRAIPASLRARHLLNLAGPTAVMLAMVLISSTPPPPRGIVAAFAYRNTRRLFRTLAGIRR